MIDIKENHPGKPSSDWVVAINWVTKYTEIARMQREYD